MRVILPFFISLLMCSLFNCGGETSSTQNNSTTTEDTTTPTDNQSDTNTETPTPPRTSHDCEVAGTVLEGNQLWLREKEILVAILADSSTYDAEYGDGHRIFVAYDTKTCQQIVKQVLPVNLSPDFPYYLAEITYNNNSQLVAIKGFKTIFCYNVEGKSLLPQLDPVFKSERYGSDASAGRIQRLEVWEDHLIGHAQEFGPFAFDMSNPAAPKAVEAFAEYEIPEQGFASLFMINSGAEGVQLILPAFDEAEEEFSINPVFDKPKKISSNVPANARNNRFLVLREENDSRTPIALDLQEHKVMDLPSDIAAKKTQDIIKWMRTQ